MNGGEPSADAERPRPDAGPGSGEARQDDDRGGEAGVGADRPGAGAAGDTDEDALSLGEIDPRGEGKLRLTLGRVRRLLAGVPAFGKLLFRLLGDPRVSLLDRAIFGAALVYLFVPMDLVPDWVPALGQMDDLLIVLLTLDRLLHRTDEAVLADHWDGEAASLRALVDLLDRATDVLPGWARALLRAG